MRKILLIGAGGHCKVVLDVLLKSQQYVVAGIIDVKNRVGEKVSGVPVVGTDADLPMLFKKGITHCFISVGSVGDTALRVKLYGAAWKVGFIFPTLIHPLASVSRNAALGEGNFIACRAIINAGARIGDQCIINTGAIVEHDCAVGDFVHISPGAVLSGGAAVGQFSHIGSGSVLIHGVRIGERTVIGAGSVVIKDIPSGVVAYGNPCRERKKNG